MLSREALQRYLYEFLDLFFLVVLDGFIAQLLDEGVYVFFADVYPELLDFGSQGVHLSRFYIII